MSSKSVLEVCENLIRKLSDARTKEQAKFYSRPEERRGGRGRMGLVLHEDERALKETIINAALSDESIYNQYYIYCAFLETSILDVAIGIRGVNCTSHEEL